MIPTGKTTDKLVFGFTYCVIAALTIWGGTRLVNASIDTRFYRDYLQEWVVAMQDYGSEGRKWPEFSGGNHFGGGVPCACATVSGISLGFFRVWQHLGLKFLKG